MNTNYMSKTQIKNRAQKAGLYISEMTGSKMSVPSTGMWLAPQQDGFFAIGFYASRNIREEIVTEQTGLLRAFLATMEERDGLYRMAR